MIKLKYLLNELTKRQKELKRDYLFRQSKLQSSNKIPTFDKIWVALKNSDSFTDEIKIRIDDPTSPELNPEVVEQWIKEEQEERYDDIVYEYQQLEGESCWRNVILHKSIDPKTHDQLGIHWAIVESAAEDYWGIHKNDYTLDCTYEAIIELKNVDWPGTIYARMDMSLGEDEQEIRFLKNAILLVEKVLVVDTQNETSNEYFINSRKRA